MDKEINDLIDKIAIETNNEEAIFQINYHDDDGRPNENLYYINANEDGVLLFAAELLNAYIINKNEENYTVPLDGPNDFYKEGEAIISYVEFTYEKNVFYKNVQPYEPPTWRERLVNNVKYRFAVFVFFLRILIFITGTVYVIKWIYEILMHKI